MFENVGGCGCEPILCPIMTSLPLLITE